MAAVPPPLPSPANPLNQVTTMPIYEYQCLDCDRAFEKIIAFSASLEPILCGHCGSAKVRKKISATSYRLANTSSSPIPAGALSGCSSTSGFS